MQTIPSTDESRYQPSIATQTVYDTDIGLTTYPARTARRLRPLASPLQSPSRTPTLALIATEQ